MNFEKYVYLLNDGLFCPKSSLFEDQWEGLIAQPDKQNDKNYINRFAKAREWIYVSCWHKQTAESYAMWKIYGEHQYAVCIETTTSKLERLSKNMDSALAIYSCDVVYGSPHKRVQGPAFSNLIESDCVLEQGLWPYATNHGVKHDAYSFEKEYRILIIDKNFNVESQNELSGITMKISPKEIIEAVIISPRAPEWFYKIVSDISSRYDLSLEIGKSRLDL
jgi:hypothetical protein